MTVKSYRDLKVWQDGVDLVESIYRVTGPYPREEMFGLTSQMRRASVSIPSNIAEGHSRSGTGEYLHHVGISLGSLAELETQIIISERLGFLKQDGAQRSLTSCESIGRMLHALQLALERRRDGGH